MKYVLGAQCVKCGREYDAVPDLTTCSLSLIHISEPTRP